MVKKGILFIVLISMVGLFFIILPDDSEELRIRILANSNDLVDLKEKEIVKDELEEVLNEIKDLNTFILEDKLKERLSGKITNSIKVELVNSYYPAKSYNNEFIPSGSYKTILITIGNGKGNNFWTLLYPEYYNIEFEDNNEIEYQIFIVDLFRKFLKN